MLKLRTNQIDQILAYRREIYDRELCEYIRYNMPSLVEEFEDPELQSIVAFAVDRAEHRGIKTSNGTLQFVVLWLSAGPFFDDQTDVAGFFAVSGLTPDEAIERILMTVSEELTVWLENPRG